MITDNVDENQGRHSIDGPTMASPQELVASQLMVYVTSHFYRL